jgi:hypothetical protein
MIPNTHWIGNSVDPRDSLAVVENRKISVPTRNQIPVVNSVAKSLYYVQFEVLTEAVVKSSIFWYIKTCSPLKVNRHCLLYAGLVLGSLFSPEDGGDTFIQNVGYFQQDTQRSLSKGC